MKGGSGGASTMRRKKGRRLVLANNKRHQHQHQNYIASPPLLGSGGISRNNESDGGGITKGLGLLRTKPRIKRRSSERGDHDHHHDCDDDGLISNSLRQLTSTTSSNTEKKCRMQQRYQRNGNDLDDDANGDALVVQLLEEESQRLNIDTQLGRFLDLSNVFFTALVILNAIQMGIGTFDFVEDSSQVNSLFELVDQIFLIIFTVELLLHLLHYFRIDRIKIINARFAMPRITLGQDAERKANRSWLMFDTFVIVISWVSVTVSIFRVFRVLRILRVLNRFPKMKRLVNALVAVIPKLALIATLLCLVFLIYGIVCTILFRDLYMDGQTTDDYFGNIALSCLTLSHFMVLDGWHKIARDVMGVYPWSWMIFVSWILLTAFVLLNLIIAVICDTLMVMSNEEIFRQDLEDQVLKTVKAEEGTRGDGKELSIREIRRMRLVMGKQRSISKRSLTHSLEVQYPPEYVIQLENMIRDLIKDQETLIDAMMGTSREVS